MIWRLYFKKTNYFMKIALCQINTVMGDIEGNTARALDSLAAVKAQGPDLIVFSELFIQGYPPSDLLEQQWFIRNSRAALDRLCAVSTDYPQTAILVGCALP
ncbi:MAG TPA: nitrilase-related carbon-nitrogen hydrolase, partial [Chitinivibrionales bacterium]